MRLRLILPRVDPPETTSPSICPYDNREGKHFELHQEVGKAVRDTVYDDVIAHRHECLHCKRTFHVYPKGVTRAQASLRVQGLCVLLCLLGLSYGAVSLTLEALGTDL